MGEGSAAQRQNGQHRLKKGGLLPWCALFGEYDTFIILTPLSFARIVQAVRAILVFSRGKEYLFFPALDDGFFIHHTLIFTAFALRKQHLLTSSTKIGYKKSGYARQHNRLPFILLFLFYP